MSEPAPHTSGSVINLELATKVELQAVRFRACCAQTHIDQQISGTCGPTCHATHYHAECTDCRLIEDHGTLAYWHKNPLRRLYWRLFHKAT